MECEVIEPEKNRLEVTFYRQNRRGKPMRIAREKYLRSDINCGAHGCKKCPKTPRAQYKLDETPPVCSEKFNFPHYLMPDGGFVLRQVDVLEDLQNVIFLQTAMEQVAQRNVSKYKRIRDSIKNRKMIHFLNEHNMCTFVGREPGETKEAYALRLFLTSYTYFRNHLSKRGIQIVILSDDPDFETKVRSVQSTEPILWATGDDYCNGLKEEFKGLVDKLCRVPFEEDAGIKGQEKPDVIFEPHLDMPTIQVGVKSGRLHQGAYRCWNFYEGFVRIDTDKENSTEYLIQGTKNINRATDGDIVAIEVLPKDQWSVASGMIVEEIEAEPPAKAEAVATGEEEEEEILAKATKSKGAEKNLRPTARVVGIFRRKWLPCCGIVRKNVQEFSTFHYFIPDNKKLPRVRIETRNIDRFEGQKIVAQIDSWPSNSRFPLGHYVKILGPAGSIETETAAVLHEHGVPHDPFSKAVEACLPDLPYIITDEERARRKDFKDIVVCSVDPDGCTDIDDALHCRKLEDGNFEVGVHIADVSHFVKPRNALDEEAAKRGTSVYLADRRIDMIPALLSSNLCSLHAGTEKLTFSCVWKMNDKADILETQFYKGIIQSKAAMTYNEAQGRLNSKETDEITVSLKGLSLLAQILRKKRFDNGALMLNTTEVTQDGELDDHAEEAHALVEEFMLLANCSVASFTLQEFREYALLRRHPVPPPTNFDALLLAAKAHNLKIVVDQGSKALNESLLNQPPEIRDILRILTTRCMTQALYCCSGTTSPTEYLHFGLAAQLYTHFTSPIRRYADLMVHRLLAIALRIEHPDPKILDSKEITTVCDNINLRHRMAQYASRASHNLHKGKNMVDKREKNKAFVMFVRRNALQVLVPKYALEGFVFFPKEGGYVYNEKDGTAVFGEVVFRALDKITVMVIQEEGDDKVKFNLVKPHVPSMCATPMEQ